VEGLCLHGAVGRDRESRQRPTTIAALDASAEILAGEGGVELIAKRAAIGGEPVGRQFAFVQEIKAR
jgi:hypothetical protein